jgi:Holliday junction resolvase
MAEALMRNAKTDHNQNEIVQALRQIGATVVLLHKVGSGVPDLLVGFRGVTHLLEVKQAKGKPNVRQEQWYREWHGRAPVVVKTIDDAINAVIGN